jgi:hypothetical protein
MRTVEEYLKAIKVGVDFGRKPLRVVWASPDGNYAVVHFPGGNYRSGQDTKYGRSSYRLVNVQADAGSHKDGYRLYTASFIAEHEGRVNKAALAALIAKINEKKEVEEVANAQGSTDDAEHQHTFQQQKRMNPELKEIQATAEQDLSNLLYQASALIEEMENKGLIVGNGHHARQAITQFGVAELRRRWRDPQPGLSLSTAWQRQTAQRDHNGAYFVPVVSVAEVESELHKGRGPLAPGTLEAKHEG